MWLRSPDIQPESSVPRTLTPWNLVRRLALYCSEDPIAYFSAIPLIYDEICFSTPDDRGREITI